MDAPPKWRRRKDARPEEIVAAALEVFAARGYAGAKLEEIARVAGISKGAIYLYFDTKEALFRAVIGEAVAPDIGRITAMAAAWSGRFADLAPILLQRLAAFAETGPLGAVVKMVIGESRNFPELARVWHDSVIAPALGIVTGLIERAQTSGELRPGDPRIHAFSLAAPMLMGVLWRETFVPIGGAPVDLAAIARQHAETALRGMVAQGDAA